jgi:hypothetical protein
MERVFGIERPTFYLHHLLYACTYFVGAGITVANGLFTDTQVIHSHEVGLTRPTIVGGEIQPSLIAPTDKSIRVVYGDFVG